MGAPHRGQKLLLWPYVASLLLHPQFEHFGKFHSHVGYFHSPLHTFSTCSRLTGRRAEIAISKAIPCNAHPGSSGILTAKSRQLLLPIPYQPLLPASCSWVGLYFFPQTFLNVVVQAKSLTKCFGFSPKLCPFYIRRVVVQLPNFHLVEDVMAIFDTV